MKANSSFSMLCPQCNMYNRAPTDVWWQFLESRASVHYSSPPFFLSPSLYVQYRSPHQSKPSFCSFIPAKHLPLSTSPSLFFTRYKNTLTVHPLYLRLKRPIIPPTERKLWREMTSLLLPLVKSLFYGFHLIGFLLWNKNTPAIRKSNKVIVFLYRYIEITTYIRHSIWAPF